MPPPPTNIQAWTPACSLRLRNLSVPAAKGLRASPSQPRPVHKGVLWVQGQVSSTVNDKKQYHLALHQSHLEASKNTHSSAPPQRICQEGSSRGRVLIH